MNKIITLFLLTIASFSLAQHEMVGTWELIENGNAGFITFHEDGYVSIQIQDELIDGHGYKEDGATATMEYSFTPYGENYILELRLTRKHTKRPQEHESVSGLFTLIDENHATMRILEDATDPSSFTDEKMSELTRVTN